MFFSAPQNIFPIVFHQKKANKLSVSAVSETKNDKVDVFYSNLQKVTQFWVSVYPYEGILQNENLNCQLAEHLIVFFYHLLHTYLSASKGNNKKWKRSICKQYFQYFHFTSLNSINLILENWKFYFTSQNIVVAAFKWNSNLEDLCQRYFLGNIQLITDHGLPHSQI